MSHTGGGRLAGCLVPAACAGDRCAGGGAVGGGADGGGFAIAIPSLHERSVARNEC